MDKLKTIPRLAKEIIITALSFVVLLAFWNFVVKEYAILSDQGLSTIGMALSVAGGVLTAIVVSFVLVIWQWSREARSSAFWRWRNALDQLVKFFDVNLEVLWGIREEIAELTLESSAVSLVSPMPRNKLKELINKVDDKLPNVEEEQKEIKEPSDKEIAYHQACMYVSGYLTVLLTAGFEHIISHDAYKQILRLEGLLYKLLILLAASVLTVAISVTNTSVGVSDTFNAPLAVILFVWFIYVLIKLGLEIRANVFLEKQFRKEVLSRKEAKEGDKIL